MQFRRKRNEEEEENKNTISKILLRRNTRRIIINRQIQLTREQSERRILGVNKNSNYTQKNKHKEQHEQRRPHNTKATNKKQ